MPVTTDSKRYTKLIDTYKQNVKKKNTFGKHKNKTQHTEQHNFENEDRPKNQVSC